MATERAAYSSGRTGPSSRRERRMSYPGQPEPHQHRPQYEQPTSHLHQQPGYGTPPTSPHQAARPARQPSRSVPLLATIGIAAGTLVIGCIGGLVIGLAGQADEPPPAAAPTSEPAESPSPAAAEPTEDPEPTESPEAEQVVIPEDLVGANAAVAADRLKELGFTRVDFGSVDAADTVVLVPSNWTVVEVEPEPGTEVSTESLVVLTCSKQ